jgi:hypothetical protein
VAIRREPACLHSSYGLRHHSEKSGGHLKDAYDELARALGWLQQNILSGSYGLEQLHTTIPNQPVNPDPAKDW